MVSSADNVSVQDLLRGKYNVVLISPEMLQTCGFVNLVLRRPEFASRVLSVVIDEVHCVSHWGADSRKHYALVGSTRAFLPRDTPIVALTATLTARVHRDLHSKLNFPQYSSQFINAGNDRPNVSVVVRAMEHTQESLADLDFVIPSVVSSPTDILKTYIYSDNIKAGGGILDHLKNLLAKRNVNFDTDDVVRPFHASMGTDYHAEAMNVFREGTIRILVCTDAAGMVSLTSDRRGTEYLRHYLGLQCP